MPQGERDFEESLRIVREILQGLRRLQIISPCTSKNCPNFDQIDVLGVCPATCQFLAFQKERNKLYSWLCGS